MDKQFKERMQMLVGDYEQLLKRENKKLESLHGLYHRYLHPVLTTAHVPLTWQYDFNPDTNPRLLLRNGINSVLNAGAIKWNGRYLLMARVEGYDRKSFFGIAESPNGVDNFVFWETPAAIPETDEPDTNIYDIRLVAHEDGWIYGLFCTERRAKDVPETDQSSAVAQCGIVRTRDLASWERLPDLVTPSPQQRNVVLHPEFVNGKYAFYTRPQDGFIEAGKGGGIGFGLADDITHAVISEEFIVDPKIYHTVYELKNGSGPAPLRTPHGWLHLAHGVRNTAAGLRYVLYMFMTDLHDLTRVICKPAGYFLAPEGAERVGDVSNVVFSNGWILDDDGTVFIYYASSDTRMHVATTTLDILTDYVMNTPADEFTSANSVKRIQALVAGNNDFKDSLTPEPVHEERVYKLSE